MEPFRKLSCKNFGQPHPPGVANTCFGSSKLRFFEITDVNVNLDTCTSDVGSPILNNPGASDTFANAINEHGVVVGAWFDGAGGVWGFEFK